MRNFEGEYFKKYFRRLNILLIVGIILFLLGIFFVVYGIREVEEVKNFNDLLNGHSTTVDEKAYLDIKIISDVFAYYDEETDAYYYATDGDYLFIVYLDQNTYKAVSEANEANKTYRVIGYTKYIEKDLMDIAIEEWNTEDLEEDKRIDNSNFHKAFGYLYLDQTEPEEEDLDYVLAAVFLIPAVVLLIIYFVYKSSAKKTINNMTDGEFNELNMEINNPDSKYYKINKLLLTPNYVVVFALPFKYYRYTDILWMWDVKQYYNFINTGKMLRIFTKDAKQSQIMSCGRIKKQEEDYEEVFNTILKHNKDIKVGFSPDNIKFSKDYKNDLKSGKIVN